MSAKSGWEPDTDTLVLMFEQERQWARDAGQLDTEYSDWQRSQAPVVGSEKRADGTVVTRFHGDGFVAIGPSRRVGK